MNNISELERLISIRIIQEDTETISSLMSSERDRKLFWWDGLSFILKFTPQFV